MLFSGSQALTFSVANRMSRCPKAPTGHIVNRTKGTPPQLLHPGALWTQSRSRCQPAENPRKEAKQTRTRVVKGQEAI